LTDGENGVNVNDEADVHNLLRNVQLPADGCQPCRVIEAETGIKPELIHSSEMGAFEVRVMDELIYSKIATGRFPDFTNIVNAVARKSGSEE
jgi:selT/selW/selH-like putative selenoprotein